MKTLIKSLDGGLPILVVLLVVSVLFTMAAGCSQKARSGAAPKVMRNLATPGGGLTKLVGFLPFSKMKILEDSQLESAFYEKMINAFKAKCPNIRLQQISGGKLYQALTSHPPLKSGRTDNFALSQASKLAGLNAVFTGSFVDISTRIEKGGVLWFKSDRYLLQVQVETEVFDSLTATKALDETIIFEEEVDESVYQQVRSKQFKHLPTIQKALQQIAGNMGEAVCRAMNDVYARGFVVGAEGDRILVSSGQEAGIKTGQTLKVFGMGEVLTGASDHRFLIPGPQIGKLKITRVYPERSEAEIVSGGPVPPGSSVSLRD